MKILHACFGSMLLICCSISYGMQTPRVLNRSASRDSLQGADFAHLFDDEDSDRRARLTEDAENSSFLPSATRISQDIISAMICYLVSYKILPRCDAKFTNWWYGEKKKDDNKKQTAHKSV